MMRLGLSTTPGLSSDFVFAGTDSVAGSGSLTDRCGFTDEP